jgi:hypothetical protein
LVKKKAPIEIELVEIKISKQIILPKVKPKEKNKASMTRHEKPVRGGYGHGQCHGVHVSP